MQISLLLILRESCNIFKFSVPWDSVQYSYIDVLDSMYHCFFYSCFRFDIKATIAELEQVLHPPPPFSQRESVDGCDFSKAVTSGQAKSLATKGIKSGVRGSTGSPAKRKFFKSEGKEHKSDRKGVDIHVYLSV